MYHCFIFCLAMLKVKSDYSKSMSMLSFPNCSVYYCIKEPTLLMKTCLYIDASGYSKSKMIIKMSFKLNTSLSSVNLSFVLRIIWCFNYFNFCVIVLVQDFSTVHLCLGWSPTSVSQISMERLFHQLL